MHSPSVQVSFKPSPLHHASCRPCPIVSTCRSFADKADARVLLYSVSPSFQVYGADSARRKFEDDREQNRILKGRIEYEIRYQHDRVARCMIEVSDMLRSSDFTSFARTRASTGPLPVALSIRAAARILCSALCSSSLLADFWVRGTDIKRVVRVLRKQSVSSCP